MGGEKIDVFCKNCGAAFSAFLREMAEHNGKLTCPCCGKEADYSAAHTHRSQAG